MSVDEAKPTAKNLRILSKGIMSGDSVIWGWDNSLLKKDVLGDF